MPICIDLYQKGHLKGIITPNKQHEENEATQSFATQQSIPFISISKNGLKEELIDWLSPLQPDLLLTITFPWLLPEELLKAPKHGSYNIHFGKLPHYRGGDPVFWQLANREKEGGVTLHKMDHDIDTGSIYKIERVPLALGETWGIHAGKLSFIAAKLAQQLLADLASGAPKLTAQQENLAAWYDRPTADDLTIKWSAQTADQIEALVNAANPTYHGALTFLNGSPVRILEVSPADVPNAPIATPGSIVYADQQYGMFVLCKDYKFIRINILKSREGIMTGIKLVALGLKQGDKFTETPQQ